MQVTTPEGRVCHSKALTQANPIWAGRCFTTYDQWNVSPPVSPLLAQLALRSPGLQSLRTIVFSSAVAKRVCLLRKPENNVSWEAITFLAVVQSKGYSCLEASGLLAGDVGGFSQESRLLDQPGRLGAAQDRRKTWAGAESRMEARRGHVRTGAEHPGDRLQVPAMESGLEFLYSRASSKF